LKVMLLMRLACLKKMYPTYDIATLLRIISC